MILNHYFDTKIPFVTNMIQECDTGDFKLRDSLFAQACEEYGITEEVAMQMMVGCKVGTFIRLSDGWIFTSKE